MSYMTIPIGDFPSGAYQGGYVAAGTSIPSQLASTPINTAAHQQRVQWMNEQLRKHREAEKAMYIIAVEDDGTYTLLIQHEEGWGSSKLITVLDKIPTLEEARDMKIARIVADKMAPEPQPEPSANSPWDQLVGPGYIQPQPTPWVSKPPPQITYWTNINTTDGHNG